MASFTLGEILKAVSGVLLQQGSHEYCTGVNTDTRTISPGELFIALQGNTFDGHHFLNDACINGASTQKNFNNEIGLSLTLLSMTPETEACVVEMGMRGLGQIAELCRIAAPTIGVVTNVGTSHIGILGSQENIAKAKGELIESLPDKGIAILNEDDPYVIRMGDTFSGNIIGYGVNGNYTVHGSRIQYENNCTKYVCTCFDEAFKVKLNMLGIHNVYNALAATATARVLGIDVNRIQKALSEFLPGAQRQFFTEINGVTVIDDSYNANPLSMEMAFHAMRQVNGKHYFLVLGDMGELSLIHI